MPELRIEDRADVRFVAGRLPVSKRPLVLVEERAGSGDLDLLAEQEILLSLDENASLEDARRLAEQLNEKVAHVSLASAR